MEFAVLCCAVGASSLIVMAVVGAVVMWLKNKQSAWRRIAGELGMTWTPTTGLGAGRMQGSVGALDVTIDTVPRGSGDTHEVWTRVTVPHGAALGLGLDLTARRGLTAIRSIFGGQDLPTGDAAFDAEVSIATRDPERALRLLSPELRRAIMTLGDRGGELSLDDTQVRWCSSGVVAHTDTLKSVVRDAARVAQAVRVASQAAQPYASDAIEARVGVSARHTS